MKTVFCHVCGRTIKSLGFSRHRKMHQELSNLTKTQKEQIEILKRYDTITTAPPSRRHNTMLALVKKGYVEQGERFHNIFKLKNP